MFNTPILFLIFNRLGTTQQVFEKIREIRPGYLYIAADGPREGNDDDRIKCENVRKYVLENVDWDCQVKTLFQEQNLGCGLNPATAITWFFEHVEEGIILEDDCVPSPSFFEYCANLLERYRNDERIYMISGSNFQDKSYGNASYFFSEYGIVWGWATWRRAWKKFDYSLASVSEGLFENKIKNVFSTDEQRNYCVNILKKLKSDFKNDIWDYQWHIAIWLNNGITITPNKNLISNIGFNNEGTHTMHEINGVSNRKHESIVKIKHPGKIRVYKKADEYLFFKTNSLRFNPAKPKVTIRSYLSKLRHYLPGS